jgi:hypothetical protein
MSLAASSFSGLVLFPSGIMPVVRGRRNAELSIAVNCLASGTDLPVDWDLTI